MNTVPQTQTRRNEGGRYSATHGSDWYNAIAEAHIARIEAQEDAERALVTALATQVGHAVTALPEAASRISKAATLVQRREVWPMTDGTFVVGSQTDSEKAYLVRRGPWRCECKHAQHRESLCAHALAAMLTVKLGTTYQPSYN